MKPPAFSLVVCGLACGMSLASRAPMIQAASSPAPFVDGSEPVELSDLYAWSSPDAVHTNLVLTLRVRPEYGWRFPQRSTFVFHVNSSPAYGAPGTETPIACHFFASNAFECWLGDSYVSGNTGVEAGVTSPDGRLRVFAGLRDDPAFFDRESFTTASEELRRKATASPFAKDRHGCFVETPRLAALAGRLRPNDPAKASDSFEGRNVMGLVLQVPTASLNVGGPVLSVWASAHVLAH